VRHSLRSRWNAAFAGLVVVLLMGGLVSALLTHRLVSDYRTTAQQIEREASDLSTLRADVVASVVATSVVARTPAQKTALLALDTRIRSRFEVGGSSFRSSRSRGLFRQSFSMWTALRRDVDAASLQPVAQRAVAVGKLLLTRTPPLLSTIDALAASGRADGRAELVHNARLEHVAYLGLSLMTLVELLLMARLARRLSVEVLRPLTGLRTTANLLATGDLGQRAAVARHDELGDLANSLNTMAHAIAGSQRLLTSQAHQDSLTGLQNRAGFYGHVEQMLGRIDPRTGRQAVLFIDLDDFKTVNDLLGHAAGDALLRVVADRLRQQVRPGDVVARLGGDEFAVLLDSLPDEAAAEALANRIVAVIAEPVDFLGHVVQVGASIGLSLPTDDGDLDALMRRADIAMYSAKGKGKNRVERYDAALSNTVAEHHALKADILVAAGRGELVLDYQPVFDLDSGVLRGVEALVRWQHPIRGLLPPSAFIALAEAVGAIDSIGTWVLRTAAQQMHEWQRRYALPELWLSVNVSMPQLEGPEFTALVRDVLRTTQLDPATLVLEVTESVLVNPRAGGAEALEELRRLGVRVALDDFGSGYSSVGYLRALPIDILKIDRSFVSGPGAGERGKTLLEGIVALGHHLGLDVLPEGIERPEELALVRALGCTSGQGFLLSRPVPAPTIDELLATSLPLPLDLFGQVQQRPQDPESSGALSP
jgi:diguanylate cyclase (GGDEF)-like protein